MNPARLWHWLSREHTSITALSGVTAMFAGLAGIAFGVITLINDDDSTSAEIEQAAVSIERRLGPDAESYDVREIVVPPEQVRTKLPESRFFPDDGFYAVSDDALGDWTYALLTEEEFYELSIGDVPELDDLPELPLHLWRGDIHEMTLPIAVNQFDYVFVERLSLEQVAEIFTLGLGEPESEGIDPEIDSEALEELGRSYRGDSIGALLVGQLQFMLPYGVADVRPVLNSIQKTGNVIYAKTTLELEDAVIDGEEYGQYFLEREIILLSTDTDVWLIQTSVGSEDRITSGSFDWVKDWFLYFGIVEE
jgi:hypothetical protein